MRIIKVGGGVLTGPNPLRALVDLVGHRCDKCVLVVSAFGKTTNWLEQVVRGCVGGHQEEAVSTLEKVLWWHRDFGEALGLPWDSLGIPSYVDTVRHAVRFEVGDSPGRLSDSLISLGEQLSSRMVAAFLTAQGIPARWVDARRIVVTDDTFGAARVQWRPTQNAIRTEVGSLVSGSIPVVAGFIGATAGGQPTTLGREGSDYTAAVMGAALRADEVVLLKDVEGVLTADPAVVPDARLIGQLSFEQAARLFRAGAKVVHPKSVEPLRRAGIALRVAPFGNPRGGTVIGPGRSWGEGDVRAIAGRCNGQRGPSSDTLSCQIAVLGEPPIASLVCHRIEESARAMNLTFRRRFAARGTWILGAPRDWCEEAIRQLHTFVGHGAEES
ncbi:aspartate kinase [Candidatus Fermentibacteria bacterium]|nr:aspartate kinase [Candidatus Fermentibacteria bacterium]